VAHICLVLADVGVLVSRHCDLQGLDKRCNGALLWLRDKQMYMVGHHYEAIDEEVVTLAGAL
jgi:hypothetical protein